MSQGTNPTYNGEGKTTLLNMIHSAPDKAELTGYKPYITGVLTSGDAADDSFLRNHLGRVYYSSLHYAGLDSLIGDSVDGSFRPITLTGLYEGTPGGSSGDPHFSSILALLHFDGSNGSTTFTDSGPDSRSVSRSGAVISTAQSKFGGASAEFDGVDDFLDIASSSDFQMGSGDFTYEGWFRFENLDDHRTVMSQWPTATPSLGAWEAFVLTSGKFRFDFETSGGRVLLLSSSTLSTNTWYHFAAVRNGTSCKLYINGSEEASATSSGPCGLNDSINIGRKEYDGGNDYFGGYIDEIRITKGVARYTAAFTAPSSAFPDS